MNIGEAAAETVGVDRSNNKFDFTKSAYVRKLSFLEGNDARMRTGYMDLVPAHEAVVDSKLVVQNRTLLSYGDIVAVQNKSLDEKTEWFQRICTQLTLPWEDGHVKMVVRRKHLLLDSVDAVMSLGRDDLRKRWRMEFLGEPGLDAGGLTKEWFELVTEQMYDPDFGLWKPTINNQMCMDINPASGTSGIDWLCMLLFAKRNRAHFCVYFLDRQAFRVPTIIWSTFASSVECWVELCSIDS